MELQRIRSEMMMSIAANEILNKFSVQSKSTNNGNKFIKFIESWKYSCFSWCQKNKIDSTTGRSDNRNARHPHWWHRHRWRPSSFITRWFSRRQHKKIWYYFYVFMQSDIHTDTRALQKFDIWTNVKWEKKRNQLNIDFSLCFFLETLASSTNENVHLFFFSQFLYLAFILKTTFIW